MRWVPWQLHRGWLWARAVWWARPSLCTHPMQIPASSPRSGAVSPVFQSPASIMAAHAAFCIWPFPSSTIFFSLTPCSYQLSASLWNKHTRVPTQLMRRLEETYSDPEFPPHLGHLQTAGTVGCAFSQAVGADNKEREPSQPLLGGRWRCPRSLLELSEHGSWKTGLAWTDGGTT